MIFLADNAKWLQLLRNGADRITEVSPATTSWYNMFKNVTQNNAHLNDGHSPPTYAQGSHTLHAFFKHTSCFFLIGIKKKKIPLAALISTVISIKQIYHPVLYKATTCSGRGKHAHFADRWDNECCPSFLPLLLVARQTFDYKPITLSISGNFFFILQHHKRPPFT